MKKTIYVVRATRFTTAFGRAVRGNTDLGEETRQRVLKRMKELNYRPNVQVVRNRTKVTGEINIDEGRELYYLY